MDDFIVASASDAVLNQLEMLVDFSSAQLVAVGLIVGCLLAFAFYKGWLL